MWTRALAVFLLAGSAFAADRHVFLNSTGGGTQLNDCPNPLHNSKGTSNTNELFYCSGAALANANNRIICDAASGCQSWTTTTGICTSPANGGTATTQVTNGVALQLDADVPLETVYGHPQACVYNMVQSDSCEIHAGTYRKAGA